ncbi:MAG: DUF4215 domain-containing protein [Candidatus Magasanikbacteria bacterium]
MSVGSFKKRISFLLGTTAAVLFFSLSLGSVFAATEDVTIDATVPSTAPVCGNNVVEGAEECDDGNTSGGDGCSAICETESGSPPPPPPVPVCGNGIPELGEECDDGNTSGGDGCSAICAIESSAVCGNSLLEGAETCDDGNFLAGDGCSAFCTIEPPPVCGNGSLEVLEECDDGNTSGGDGCSALCITELPPAVCGDSFVESAEECDDGNTSGGDGCSALCFIEAPIGVCGDGGLHAGEECDDGNNINGDGCSAMCFIEGVFPVCGDGLVGGSEQCDDGNNNSGDGCNAACQIETVLPPVPPGTEPPTTPGPGGPGYLLYCGNGELEEDEACDDGNIISGDGCSEICEVEDEDDIVTEPDEQPDEKQGAIAGAVDAVSGVISSILPDSASAQIASITKTISEGIDQAQELADNPTVEKVTESVVAPAIVTAVAAAVLPSLWSILFPFLRFLFLQPLLLFGRRRRKDWGTVYNSLNKLPVDLAIVRLIHKATNKVVRSRVTDKSGRYLFRAQKGEYVLEVVKNGFTFPTQILQSVQSDGEMVDIYHGEIISVSENDTKITPNIPIDPIGAAKTPKRILWEGRLRILQHVLSLGGVMASLIALYISSTPLLWGFLIIHIVLYAFFLRFIKPKKPNGWGIVYDEADEKPIGRAVARLFSKEYSKLVSTELTDSNGHYVFLAGPSDYYVTFEKDGYIDATKEVTVEAKEEVVKERVGLKKSSIDSNSSINRIEPVDSAEAHVGGSQIEQKSDVVIEKPEK